MKIIGKTENGYLISARGDEIAELAGHYCEGSAASHGISYKPGFELDISKLYNSYRNISLEYQSHIKQEIESLLSIVESLKVIQQSSVIKDAIELKDEFKGFRR